MSKRSLSLCAIVALSLYADQAAAARMVATRVSAHQQTVVALTEQQQQFRKASETAEATIVCRKPEIKATINADLSVDGVTDINWDTVKKTAGDGMRSIEKTISDLGKDIGELEVRIRELEEAGKWGALGESDMNEMLYAACTHFQEEGNPTNDCSWAVTGECGWNDPALMDNFIDPPFDEPIASFREAAAAKIKGYAKLPVPTFRAHCASVLTAEWCADLCMEFSEVVRELSSADSAEVLGNTETLDQVKAQHKEKLQLLESAKAEKESCQEAQKQIQSFQEQLGALSSNYKDNQKAVSKYKRDLRMQQMRLRRQIQILEQKRKLLEQMKAIFAAASQQVIERQKDVDAMQAILDDLRVQLEAQLALIARIEKAIDEIQQATATVDLIKNELSRILQNAFDTNVEAIHKPLETLKITAGADIAATFEKAEADAAPAMKSTVRQVADYCATEETTAALTSSLIDLKKDKKLNFICVGQDWNNMIAEAEATTKDAITQVTQILKAEQDDVKSDRHVPVAGSQELREASGEPKMLRHVVATFAGKGGSFVDGYVNPGWTVDVDGGKVNTIGKMLMLYQKLGEAAEKMQKEWDEAEAGRIALEAKIAETVKELERLQELLRQAIEAKQIAKENMDKAQEVYDENERIKNEMEEHVKTKTERLESGNAAVEAVKESLLKTHRERAAALVQILQELKK